MKASTLQDIAPTHLVPLLFCLVNLRGAGALFCCLPPQLLQLSLLLFFGQRFDHLRGLGEVYMASLRRMELGLRMAPELSSAIVTNQALSYFTWLECRPDVGVIGSGGFAGIRVDFLNGLFCVLVQPVDSLIH